MIFGTSKQLLAKNHLIPGETRPETYTVEFGETK